MNNYSRFNSEYYFVTTTSSKSIKFNIENYKIFSFFYENIFFLKVSKNKTIRNGYLSHLCITDSLIHLNGIYITIFYTYISICIYIYREYQYFIFIFLFQN